MKLRQATLSMWYEGTDPLHDAPSESVGVMQCESDGEITLASVQRFAADVLAKHWHGECGCQTGATTLDKGASRPRRTFRVGVAEVERGAGRKPALLAYTRYITASCCTHPVEAASGAHAKTLAAAEHRERCVQNKENTGG